MVSLPFGGDMVLWTTPDKFYISSEESPSRLMLIDRVTGQATGYSLSDQHISLPISANYILKY